MGDFVMGTSIERLEVPDIRRGDIAEHYMDAIKETAGRVASSDGPESILGFLRGMLQQNLINRQLTQSRENQFLAPAGRILLGGAPSFRGINTPWSSLILIEPVVRASNGRVDLIRLSTWEDLESFDSGKTQNELNTMLEMATNLKIDEVESDEDELLGVRCHENTTVMSFAEDLYIDTEYIGARIARGKIATLGLSGLLTREINTTINNFYSA
jgi:hypothetical protein